MYKYYVEMHRKPKDEPSYWEVEIRSYRVEKNLTDFDLKEIPDWRRNVKFIGKE